MDEPIGSVLKRFVQSYVYPLTGCLDSGITANAVFPGYASTNLYRELPGFLLSLLSPIMKSVEETAANILFCAIAPGMF